MNKAFRLVLGLSLLVIAALVAALQVDAQSGSNRFNRQAENAAAQLPQLPRINFDQFSALVFPGFRPTLLPPPLLFSNNTAALLHEAIARRLGIRYRFFGTDDRGYDCSGFVWRVFQEAGGSFERVAARTLWRQLPEATGAETEQFGTLVFFNNLKHVGIMRDARSFYHASRKHGVTLSSLTGYWGTRITGYRRAPVSVAPEFFQAGE